MKKIFLFLLVFVASNVTIKAEEGMWIPMLLEQLNISQMQSMGLKLTADDIYNINRSSLKDAIVQFGGGCTAEIVSPNGLILTNHHCGLGAIQRLSDVDHDFLKNGFWAGSFEQELPASGITVTLLVRMEDVTGLILGDVTPEMTQFRRAQIIRQNIENVEKESVREMKYEGKIRPFYYGNQYYLFITQTFKDVRLVGAPPSAIGQFGGDSDNWMWPRHGGDFSLFRIYVDKNNEPAAYSKDNVPYKPKNYIPVSLKGYAKGDFTFVFGYPGATREYITSYGVDLTANKENPVRIELRQKRLEIFNSAMNTSPKIRIQYTSKHQGIANGWKKMIGETRGIRRMDAVTKKQDFEKNFQEWSELPQNFAYHPLLNAFQANYEQIQNVDMASVYLAEGGLGIEIVRFAGAFQELVKTDQDKTKSAAEVRKISEKLYQNCIGFFKDYNPNVDKQVAVSMLKEMGDKMDRGFLPDVYQTIETKYRNDIAVYVADLFSKSLMVDSSRIKKFLKNFSKGDSKKVLVDPVYQLAVSFYSRMEKNVTPALTKFNTQIDSLQRLYMAGQIAMLKDKRFYPDANSTLRISYGKIDDFDPADAVHYNYFTTSEGILQKEDPSVYDYSVDPRLKSLFQTKDFGPYADRDGSLHVAFIGSNHTTGGNSGSPVLDANGYLIGINFDRNWEGTMSDLMYDPSQCRNITLDIRYCLFIIDKYAGAKRLIDEMKIIN